MKVILSGKKDNSSFFGQKERPFCAPHSIAKLRCFWALATMVLGSMPMKQSAPSSAKPTGEHGLLSFSNLSNGSNAKFQILLLRTPPCGVPQTGLIVLMMPRTSAIEFLFLRKFIYHLIIIGGYLLPTRTL